MELMSISRKVLRGMPYLLKEARAQISDHSPLFVARPRVVHLWRKARCNGRCIMCTWGFRTREDDNALSTSPLTDELIPRVLDEIHELGGRGTMVSYVAGEPLLARPLFEWLDQAKRLALDFRFTTNGYLVNQRVAQRLVAARLFNIGVSLESLDPAINEQIRPIPGGTAKTIQAIDLLIAERRRQTGQLSINIKCTLTQLNTDAIIGILERWGKTDGVIVTPQPYEVWPGTPRETEDRLWIKDVGRLASTLEELGRMRAAGYHLNADDHALADFLRRYRDEPPRESKMHRKTEEAASGPECNIGTDNLFIIDGEVKLCPHFRAIGSVLTEGATLKQLWGNPAAKKTREEIRQCRAVCTQSCLRRTTLRHKVKIFLRM